MIQQEFAKKAKEILQADQAVIGLAAGGSWITAEMDEFSDLDLVLVTREKIAGNKELMLDYANRLGTLLSAFTGEHVGEPRLLICLYDQPLLHVDIKFLTPEEFHSRVEDPVILLDRDGQLQEIINQTEAKFPYPDYQWIEDRFWAWIHYALLKTGRGEYLEALDFFGFLRMTVLGPLLQIKHDKLPKGVRRAESQLHQHDLQTLLSTVPAYEKRSLINALENAVLLYRELRQSLFTTETVYNYEAEKKVMLFFEDIRHQLYRVK